MTQLNRRIALTTLGLDAHKQHTVDDIKRAFRSKALLHHPDKSRSSTVHDSSSEFVRISAAYHFLINEKTDHNNEEILNKYEIFVKITQTFLYLLNKFLHDSSPLEHQGDDNSDYRGTGHDTDADGANSVSSDDCYYETEEGRVDDNYYDNKEAAKHHNPLQVCIDITIDELYLESGKKLKLKIMDENSRIQSRDILIPFVDYRPCMIFHECGDWNNHKKCYDDLVLTLNIASHPNYSIHECMNPFDLIRSFDISVSEYFDDMQFGFNHFGEFLQLRHSPWKDGKDLILKGKGLKKTNSERGDLYVLLNVDLTISNLQEITQCDKELKRMFPTSLSRRRS